MAARLISFRIGIIDAANLLSNIYEPVDLKQSYRYFKMATAAKDSIFNRVKFNAIQAMTAHQQVGSNFTDMACDTNNLIH